MGSFKIGHGKVVTDLPLDSTPKDGDGQRRITLTYDGWPRHTTPRLVMGANDSQSTSFARIVSQNLDAKTRSVSFTLEALPNASGVSYVWDDGSNDSQIFRLQVGKVLNHTGLDFDLIANLGRSENPRNLLLYKRIFDPKNNDLGPDDDDDYLEHWQKNLKDQPMKQYTGADASHWNCGGATATFDAVAFGVGHNLWGSHNYYGPMKANAHKQKIKAIPFLADAAKAGAMRMKNALVKGTATVVFAVHDDDFSTGGDGRVKPSGLTHYLSVVGCNAAADTFLVSDPWPGGSQLKYRSGIFDDNGGVQCNFLGLLFLKPRWGDLDDKGALISTAQPSGGYHDYFVLAGG